MKFDEIKYQTYVNILKEENNIYVKKYYKWREKQHSISYKYS